MKNNEKYVIEDCVKFKHDLYRISWEKSGAKTIDEYVKYVSEKAKKASWWINKQQVKK